MQTTPRSRKTGFTLLELLIVIAIISVDSAILIFTLNPGETLKKSRDTQRLADLSSLQAAVSAYVGTAQSPDLDAALTTHCFTATPNTKAMISYSIQKADAVCVGDVEEGAEVTAGSFSKMDFCRMVGTTGASAIDGKGWVPVAFNEITDGSPISRLPLDPVNTIATLSSPTSADLVYRYACQNDAEKGKPDYVFEIDAQLESEAFTVTDDMRTRDGGDNDAYFELGTSTKLIGPGTNF